MLEQWLEGEIEVIPAVDVLGEGAVRLHQGAYDEVVARAGDPVDLARAYAEAGAARIHLVDLDGARSGRVRPELARAVAAAIAPAVLQASGGIRSLDDARALPAGGVRSPADIAALASAGAEAAVVGRALLGAKAQRFRERRGG